MSGGPGGAPPGRDAGGRDAAEPRQRPYLAERPDWRPSASLETIQARAALCRRLRAYFAEAGVMEVETPILSRAAVTAPALASLASRVSCANGEGRCDIYLQTSPEFPMKRLLAAGTGPIFQICKVFRDEERGRLHHPEFSLLEWYRPGWDYHRLMEEVVELVRVVLQRPAMPVERISYRDLFRERLSLDPWSATPTSLCEAALGAGLADARELDLDRDAWLDLLLAHCLEPGLGRRGMTFLYDYPPSQAALARIRPDPFPVAERFELYVEGMELANGFQELTDASEQRERFESDLALRRHRGQSLTPIDEPFLAALEAGLPTCAGVALGLDRLLMVATGADHIDAVIAFPVERA